MPAHDEHNSVPLALIADDDELMRSLMAVALAEKGFDTFEVGNGRDALELIRRLSPHLVILDVQMPEMDGFETCEQIRATEDGVNLPIVMVTGTDDTESIERAYDVGATDFISKPVNWSLLGHRMQYILRSAQTRAALIRSESANRAMLEALPDRLLLVTRSGEVIRVLEGGRADTTASWQEVQSIEALLPMDVATRGRRVIAQVLDSQREQGFEFSIHHAGNADEPQTYHEARVVPQSESVALMVIRDVTEKRLSEQRIQRLAFYDTLTNLPNRHYFQQFLGDVLAYADDADRFVLLIVGLDQFKRVNDTLGHAAGDEVLVQVAARLEEIKRNMRSTGQFLEFARLGGDEFALLDTQHDDAYLTQLVEKIDASLQTPLTGEGYQLVVTPSVGIASYPRDGKNMAILLQHATQALSAAKSAGGNARSFYSDRGQDAPGEALQLEFDLRMAQARQELTLYFQPKYDLHSGVMVGAEALLRWIHPEHGIIAPGVFIPIAEQSGLIIDIDSWVCDRLCQYLATWQRQSLPCVPMSFNTSGRVFSFGQPVATLQQALSKHDVDAGLLEIEITETALMADPDKAANTLTALKAMGIRLAMDDFGTGYSSLAYLKKFPLDVLKIDRAFVKDLEDDGNDRALCKAMISMAHSLGLEVVAEGIETEFQRAFLERADCQMGQGFLMDKPIAADEFELRLASMQPPRAPQHTEQSPDRPATH